MRILFLSREYPPQKEWGGIGTYTATMAATLAGRGHEVHVLSCVDGQQERDLVDHGVHVHLRGEVRIRGLGRLAQMLRAPVTEWRIILGATAYFEYRRLGIDFDVIEYADWGAMGWVFSLLERTALVAHMHCPPLTDAILSLEGEGRSMNRDTTWAAWLGRLSTDRADAVTCVSGLLARTLKSIGWLRRGNAEVIPLPMDWSRWSSTEAVLESPPTALFVGRLEATKAPELLVDAISIVRRMIPLARATFVGRDTNYQEGPASYLERIKHSRHVDGCDFVSEVPREELGRFYSSSRVVVVPSAFDAFPFVVLEAMASGRPVVVTETTGQADFVDQARAGSVVPPGNAEAIAEAILPFLLDPAHAAEVGERGRRFVREQLDSEVIAERRERVYRQAIVASRCRPWWKSRGFLHSDEIFARMLRWAAVSLGAGPDSQTVRNA